MIRLAIVGLGKIARDQHLPAIAKTEGIELVAIASRNATLEGVPHFAGLDELLASDVAVDAVALCTPPQVRREQAALALSYGKHVLLEKPPGATVSELAPLVAAAQASGRTLFATWHSRFAPAVEPARAFLAEHAPRAVTVEWKEDVRVWHPGQDWIFEPGGLGVFDPGINALSILTRILPNPFFLTKATLGFPANRDAPIEAALDFADSSGVPIRAELDFLQTGPQTWDIHVETAAGKLTLSLGGSKLFLDGKSLIEEPEAEYPGIYRHFVDLVACRASDVDLSPLQHVADAFLLGRRIVVEPFEG
ncbi:Gfo/Idh/MocA family oxidoreductase [Ancylobacter sonchi]|uniref:Gfo/Idh/MocA family protein n=1 Tax=Ancylobacter sonchi TaxID=1937790 RepID=UPI001BD5A180|nr:Gfo/Idh/MocA family oxidoreductase [Ancylobacter sonchi]MBS7533531.1 Gfo/Idh/MocA family oxidoreductase [Ancylobacter sonchi]